MALNFKKEPPMTLDAVGMDKAKISFEQTSPPQKKTKKVAVIEGQPLSLGTVVAQASPVDKTQYMEGWTDDQWDNLQMSALKILTMIAHPAVNNKAWRNQLKMTLDTINGFRT